MNKIANICALTSRILLFPPPCLFRPLIIVPDNVALKGIRDRHVSEGMIVCLFIVVLCLSNILGYLLCH